MIKLQKRNIVISLAVFWAVFLLAVLSYLAFKKTENVKKRSEGSANLVAELQKKVLEQQLIISTLQEENKDKEQKIVENTETVDAIESERTKEQDCQTVRNLYTGIPTKPENASRLIGFSNIVSQYKAEKEFLESNEGKGDKRLANDFVVIKAAYYKYLEAKKLCPEFKEF
jgi:hypothetical protein